MGHIRKRNFILPLLSLLTIGLSTGTIVLAQDREPDFEVRAIAKIIIGKPPSLTICDNVPTNIPCGWPGLGPITQGPNTTFSHNRLIAPEAIDIGGVDGQKAYATLDGKAVHLTPDSSPNSSMCGIDIAIYPDPPVPNLNYVLYCHLKVGSRIADGTRVRRGQVIGGQDNTGSLSGFSHIHYAFSGGLEMDPPYIPLDVPDGCLFWSPNPCNIEITSLGFEPLE